MKTVSAPTKRGTIVKTPQASRTLCMHHKAGFAPKQSVQRPEEVVSNELLSELATTLSELSEGMKTGI